MTARTRLPQKRSAVAGEFWHCNQRFRAHVGHFSDGRPAELFLDSSKPDSQLDAFAADSAVLISLLLQFGAAPADIGHALRRNPNGTPASLVGAAVDQLLLLERAS